MNRYDSLFRVYRHEQIQKASHYLAGLFQEGKHNIERMNERIEHSEYQSLHHFISVSPWDHNLVLSAVRQDLSKLFIEAPLLTGLILDESGHRKRGKKSVGVSRSGDSRQYLGSIGKVDNGQVAIFAALSQGDNVGMVNTRLYLPKTWTEDQQRCDKAGIPIDERAYRTKPELALEMIREMERQIVYDWVGGDSIYGNSKTLRQGLQQMDKLFVMDVSEDLPVFVEDPKPYVPVSPPGKGRKKSSYISEAKPLKVKDLAKQLPTTAWKSYTVRAGTKGHLLRQVTVKKVFVWSAQRPTDGHVEQLRLIISSNIDGREIKYSVTNDIALAHRNLLSDWGALYRQMQRYWTVRRAIERGIQDCKDTLSMTDYQVRGWRAWYHHITLTIMALHYMLEQKVAHANEIPLISCPDIKLFLALTLPKKVKAEQEVWALIQKRHEQRQTDLNRYYSKMTK